MTMKLPTFIPTAADNLFSHVWGLASAMGAELTLFFLTMFAYAVLFNLRWKEPRPKLKIVEDDCFTDDNLIHKADTEGAAPKHHGSLATIEESTSEGSPASSDSDDDIVEVSTADVVQLLREVCSDDCQSAPCSTDSNEEIAGNREVQFPVDSVVVPMSSALEDEEQAFEDRPSSSIVENELTITGPISKVKAACKSLRKQGFIKNCSVKDFPLNGHWTTEHGMNVVIDGKIVRWSHKRASRLKFCNAERTLCSLSVYGEPAQGRAVLSATNGLSRSLRWSNGDVWHSSGSCKIAQAEVCSTHIGKMHRHSSRDLSIRKRTRHTLLAVCKEGLSLLPNCLDMVLEFVGSSDFAVTAHFTSLGHSERGVLQMLSTQHRQVGLRHRWSGSCGAFSGQRCVTDARDVDEEELYQNLQELLITRQHFET